MSGSSAAPGARLLDLVATMDRLRSPGGCPWDREQTHASLAPYLLEEAYEAVEAIETGEIGELPGELGDVLLQVVFHSRVAQERDDGTGFTIDDVAGAIVDKLVRRHPHVFADVEVSGADEVKTNWDAIKAAERAGDDGSEASVVHGVPLGQPALSLAQALQKRATRAGLPDDLLASPRSGLSTSEERSADATEAGGQSSEASIGAELFALVARARAQGVDPEAALRHVSRTFRDQVLAVEASVRAAGGDLSSLPAEDWRERWLLSER